MNNVIDFKNQKVSNVFANLKTKKSLGDGITAGGFPVLNMRGKTWSLRYQGQTHKFLRPDDGTALTYLDLIILDTAATTSQIYFGEWNGEDGSSDGPICGSIKGDVPDPGVPVPQSKSCATCERSQWTVKPSGKRTPECQKHKRLAVLLMPAMTKKMLGAPLMEPVYLKVPPGSLPQLKAYGDMLDHANLQFPTVLTRISFDPVKLFQINFEPQRTLDDREAETVLPFIEDPRTKRIIGETPIIREVPLPKQPVFMPAHERVETGLVEAFDDDEVEVVTPPPSRAAPPPPRPLPVQIDQEVIPPPVKPKRGRPPKATTQLVEEIEPTAEVVEENGELPFDMDQEDVGAEQAPAKSGNALSALNDRVAQMLNKKTDGVLK